MDTYFRKTRRIAADLSSISHKRPSISRKLNFEPIELATAPASAPASAAPITTTRTTPTKSIPNNQVVECPTTPTGARIPRPDAPPPVKRKLLPDDLKQARRKRRPTTIKDLFDNVHPHEIQTTLNDPTQSTCPQNTDHDLGLRRLEIPPALATPPETPIKSTPIKSAVTRLLGTTTSTPTTSTSTSTTASPTKPQPPDSPSKVVSGPLRGISTTLLDRIRAKEAAAKSITPEQLRRQELLGIAPELVRIISTIYTANKKDIILYNTIVEKCSKGLKNRYTTGTVIECLELMMKVAPEWISIVEISRGKFMRLNKTQYSLHQLLKAIKLYKDGKD